MILYRSTDKLQIHLEGATRSEVKQRSKLVSLIEFFKSLTLDDSVEGIKDLFRSRLGGFSIKS